MLGIQQFLIRLAASGTVRSRLTLLVLACVLPMFLFAVMLLYAGYEMDRQQMGATITSRARAMVSALDREFARTEAALLTLSTIPLNDTDSFRRLHAQAILALREMNADCIVVLDDQGRMLLSTELPFGSPLPQFQVAPLMKQALASGKPGISDLYPGGLAGQLLFQVGVPFRFHGRAYSIYAMAVPKRLAPILTEQRLPTTWRATIADATGHIVARSYEADKYIGREMRPEILSRIAAANEDAFLSRSLDGVPVLTSYSRSPTSQWSVVLGMPSEELSRAINRDLFWLSMAALVALAAGLALAAYIAGQIARAMARLIEPARALGEGRAVEVAPLPIREAEQVRRALYEASSALRRARHEALHDPLTGLANRAAFNELVGQQLILAHRSGVSLAILYVDLDGFKAVNDTHGHAAGDALLCAVAGRMRAAVRESDMVARLGGDEFAIALIDSDIANARTLAVKLIEDISAPYNLGEVTTAISCSIGIAESERDSIDSGALIKAADKAMYSAKLAGKRRVAVTP